MYTLTTCSYTIIGDNKGRMPSIKPEQPFKQQLMLIPMEHKLVRTMAYCKDQISTLLMN